MCSHLRFVSCFFRFSISQLLNFFPQFPFSVYYLDIFSVFSDLASHFISYFLSFSQIICPQPHVFQSSSSCFLFPRILSLCYSVFQSLFLPSSSALVSCYHMIFQFVSLSSYFIVFVSQFTFLGSMYSSFTGSTPTYGRSHSSLSCMKKAQTAAAALLLKVPLYPMLLSF
jgi:hypothetical protein